MHTLNIVHYNTYYSNIVRTFLMAGLFAFILDGIALAQTIDNLPNARIEKAKKVGKMRHKCRLLSNQLVPKLSSAEFMQNSQQKNEAYTEKRKSSFLQCLKLSKLATGYTPDLVTLQNALPHYQKSAKNALKTPSQKTALTINVKQKGARIRILNIKPAYHDKLLVTPGLYHIRVEKEGFAKWDQWLKVKGKTFVYGIDLKPRKGSNQTITTQAKTAKTATKNPVTKAKTDTNFQYAKRRANPAAENKLAKISALAVQKRAKRTAFIKAKVAAKKEAKRLALIQKQHPLGTQKPQKHQSSPAATITRLREARFKNQVQINKDKLERGRRILATQRKLNAQSKHVAP